MDFSLPLQIQRDKQSRDPCREMGGGKAALSAGTKWGTRAPGSTPVLPVPKADRGAARAGEVPKPRRSIKGFSCATTPRVTLWIFITSLSKVSSCSVKLLMSRAGYQRLKSTRQRMMGT